MSGVTWLKQRRDDANEKIAAALKDLAEYALLPAEQFNYPKDTIVWKTTIVAKEREWELHVLLPINFPDEPPKARVLDAGELFLINPHIDRDGYLCVIPDSSSIDSSDSVGVFKEVVNSVGEILEGTTPADFQDEFTSYWSRTFDDDATECIVIDSPEIFPNVFDVVIRDKLICASASSESLNLWLANKFAECKDKIKTVKQGTLLWLDAPLVPDEYPNTLNDLVELVRRKDPNGAYEQVKNHILHGSDPGLVLIVQKTDCGYALGAVRYWALNLGKDTSLLNGFRKGKAPQSLIMSRAKGKLKTSPVLKCPVKRVDHTWVHARGGDGSDYQQKTILCIGCGSLGGYIAHFLSRAGVGKLLLLDNDKLEWANFGRHILGAEQVHQSKAEALGTMLKTQMPHLNVLSIPEDWRSALKKNEALFGGIDLIIATTGDWRCEGPLNHLSRSMKFPPILYGWLEPYAVAGHCLVSVPGSGCFACGMNSLGQFLHNVADFQDFTLKREPGGCTHYQQYGATALLPVASMISSMALRCLSKPVENSILKTWISDKTHFRSLKVDLTDKWDRRVGPGGFEKIYSYDWNSVEGCSICH
ncbi:ThiF family adenylyltransferase [Planctomycetota bacterium]